MTTFTREDYEMAAKAAGIALDFTIRGDFPPYYINERGGHSSWNPPDDDGDAFRLAVKLRMNVFHAGICAYALDENSEIEASEGHEDDPASATRRAIFCAAIAIGRAMP